MTSPGFRAVLVAERLGELGRVRLGVRLVWASIGTSSGADVNVLGESGAFGRNLADLVAPSTMPSKVESARACTRRPATNERPAPGMASPRDRCEMVGCWRTAEVSVRFGGPVGLRRYCTRCADTIIRATDQPALVVPDWQASRTTGSVAVERIVAIGCRDCGDRRDLTNGQVIAVRCPACGGHGRSCRRG